MLIHEGDAVLYSRYSALRTLLFRRLPFGGERHLHVHSFSPLDGILLLLPVTFLFSLQLGLSYAYLDGGNKHFA